MPILSSIGRLIKLTNKINNKTLKCGVKISAYLYLLGIIVYITLFAIGFLIAIAIVGLVLMLVLWGSNLESGKERAIVNVLKRTRFGDAFPFADNMMEKLKSKFGKDFGRLDNDGKIYSKDVIPTQIGVIDDHGNFFDTRELIREKIGEVDENGNVS